MIKECLRCYFINKCIGYVLVISWYQVMCWYQGLHKPFPTVPLIALRHFCALLTFLNHLELTQVIRTEICTWGQCTGAYEQQLILIFSRTTWYQFVQLNEKLGLGLHILMFMTISDPSSNDEKQSKQQIRSWLHIFCASLTASHH